MGGGGRVGEGRRERETLLFIDVVIILCSSAHRALASRSSLMPYARYQRVPSSKSMGRALFTLTRRRTTRKSLGLM